MSFQERALKLALAESESADVQLVSCPETEDGLYYVVGSRKFLFSKMGTCVDCKLEMHFSNFKVSEGMVTSSWPVHYTGYYCSHCYFEDSPPEVNLKSLPEDIDDLLEEEK